MGHHHGGQHDLLSSPLASLSTTPLEPADVVWFKVKAFVVLLLIGALGGLLPLKARELHSNRDRYLALGNTFSGGLFLCAGFSHMLGEALEGFQERELPVDAPLLYCLFGILATLFVEKVLLSYFHGDASDAHGGGGGGGHSHVHGLLNVDHEIDSTAKSRPSLASTLQTYMLTILLSMHSIIEGVALGVEENIDDASRVLMAIAAHKSFAAFALGLSLVRGGASNAALVRIVMLFAFMSPVGVLLGALFTLNLDGDDSVWSGAIQAFAAGSFIYVALVEILLEEFSRPHDRALKFVLMLLGVGVMLSL
jgi:zinc transporter 1/2/3